MAKKSLWQDLVEKLDQPSNLWPLVILGVVLLIQLRLILFAAALPAVAYWHLSRQAEEEEYEQEPETTDADADDDEVPDQGGIQDFDDNSFIPGNTEPLDVDRTTDNVNPYDETFWGSDDALSTKPVKKNTQPPQKNDFGIDDLNFEPLGAGLDDQDFLGPISGGGRSKGRGKGKGKDKSKNDGLGSDPGPRGPDPKQVFVAGIGDLAEEDIRTFFEKVGEVDRIKILCEPDGQSKGVCFVTFHSEAQAHEALNLHGADFEGKRLTVRAAHGGKGGGKASSAPSRRDPPNPSSFEQFSSISGGKDAGSGGRGKGSDTRRAAGEVDESRTEPRTEIDDLLEEALEEEDGPLQLKDFDSGAKRFLTELMQLDRTQGTKRSVEALEMVFKQTRSKDRDAVRKWPAYIFTLLQKFDPELSDEIAQKRLLERDAERRRGGGGRSDAPRSNDIARAWEFLPDASEADGHKQVLDRWGKPVLL